MLKSRNSAKCFMVGYADIMLPENWTRAKMCYWLTVCFYCFIKNREGFTQITTIMSGAGDGYFSHSQLLC